MTYVRELPACDSRFGRSEIMEIEKDGIIKKTAKLFLACGYREVEPEECIICRGLTNVKFDAYINTFIRMVKYKRGRF